MKSLARRAPDRVLLAVAAVAGAVEAAASIIRHVHLQSGFDLALADQAVWHYSRFEAPFSSLLQKNILGDHFSPLVAVLAPLYWLWSDPRMLLIAQAVLISASIIPVFLFAEQRLGRVPALLLSSAYAFFWALQVGALYDFHELAFAPLLVASAILLCDRAITTRSPRQWIWFWVMIVLLLAVKEDLAILVVFFGLYILSRRELRHGIALLIVGIAWYELATGVFIPHFSAGMAYSHWTYQELGKNLPDALWTLLRAPWRVFTIGLGTGQKVQTILGLFAPFLFLSFGSRLFILAAPLLAERFLSTFGTFWVAHYHYSLTIAPVVAMAAADGLNKLAAHAHVVRRSQIILISCAAMLLASLAITRLASSDSALSELLTPSFYRAPGYVAGAHEAIAAIPRQASLATDDYLLPHVSERNNVRLIEPQSAGRVSYVMANVLQSVCCSTGNPSYGARGQVLDGQLAQMQPVFYASGWLVAARAPPGRTLANDLLAPLRPASARRAARAVAEVSGSLTMLRTCVRSPFAAVDGCPLEALAHASAGVALLGRTLALQAQPGGACERIGKLASAAGHSLKTALSAISEYADRGDRAGFSRQFESLLAANANLDLVGALERFAILCTRPGPHRST